MKAETREAGQQLVWHIFEFNERLELRVDKGKPSRPGGRTGGLMFIQVPVGANDASAHLEDLEYEEGFTDLVGSYVVLARKSSARKRCYRGYLLAGQYRPASTSHIARWLHKSPEETAKVLEKLRRVGLLDRVPLPAEWNVPPLENGEVEQDEQNIFNENPCLNISANVRTPLDQDRLDKSKTDPEEIQKDPSDAENESQAESQDEQSPEPTPTQTTSPMPIRSDAAGADADGLPTKVDAGGKDDTEPSVNPPPALSRPGQDRYGPKLVLRHGTEALDTANDLLRLLGYKAKTQGMSRQWGNLATWWNAVKAESWAGEDLESIKAQAFTKADRVGRDSKVAMGSKPKYLRTSLDNLVKDFKAKRKGY